MANDGKDFERLVHLIEGSIDPDSIVEHNVHLPVISHQDGGKRQCDVVIRTGKPPRETITIVEVQDRGSRVDRGTFDSWLVKMEEVGAQHLLCISRHEFPSSIKSKALTLGNSVRLITLKELDVDSIPLDFFNFVFVYRKFDLTKVTDLSCGLSVSEAETLGILDAAREREGSLNANERCWSLDQNELVSLFILCRDYFEVPVNMSDGEDKISFSRDGEPALFMYIEGKFLRVGLECKFSWTNEIIRKPASILSYEQNEEGALAWVVEASHETPKGPISFKAPVVKCDEGYRMQAFLTEIPEEHSLTLLSYKAQ